jgi:hypothetical protein
MEKALNAQQNGAAAVVIVNDYDALIHFTFPEWLNLDDLNIPILSIWLSHGAQVTEHTVHHSVLAQLEMPGLCLGEIDHFGHSYILKSAQSSIRWAESASLHSYSQPFSPDDPDGVEDDVDQRAEGHPARHPAAHGSRFLRPKVRTLPHLASSSRGATMASDGFNRRAARKGSVF